jgi:hypothetical protein
MCSRSRLLGPPRAPKPHAKEYDQSVPLREAISPWCNGPDFDMAVGVG